MALSMTGFGAAEGDVAGRQLRVEIRTVNHRWFNFAARLPSDLAALEAPLRDRMRREFVRGHVAVGIRWVGDGVPTLVPDASRVAPVVGALRALQRQFGLAGDVTVELAARYADLFGARDGDGATAVEWEAVDGVVSVAATACRAERTREGAALVAELADRLELLQAASRRIAGLAPGRLDRERRRLEENLGRLLAGAAVDSQRVAQELAVAADRLDITEDLVRLDAHFAAARAALVSSDPVGKQLGFLAQEMGREMNTIGAKANDTAIAHEVVGMKGELERLREQVENLE